MKKISERRVIIMPSGDVHAAQTRPDALSDPFGRSTGSRFVELTGGSGLFVAPFKPLAILKQRITSALDGGTKSGSK